ncbi:mechanosensitive ion channel family protein [Pontibacter anaerobius]|uniref:Mechanosensitive ion channel n=1 Tax=Pontibacter anaerobius TaxID=2993940 RepID=A0ABT3RIV9_9BACT|nr:mechanosensitive ion channel domain-containing protein [Pontibacter anaerobius]MCX2741277.1 mechanosensitive ion channel [Pontibacter anaerobius]
MPSSYSKKTSRTQTLKTTYGRSRYNAGAEAGYGTGRVTPAGRQAIRKARTRRVKRGSTVEGAKNRLKNFRQATILAVAVTGFIMLLFAPSEAGLAQDGEQEAVDTVAIVEEVAVADLVAPDSAMDTAAEDTTSQILSGKEAAGEAIGALQGLWDSFFYNLPKMLIALGTLLLAWGVVRLLRLLLQKVLGRWERSNAIISLLSIAVWLLAIGIAISVVAGDIRALVGSLGLIGLALSWSLQTPIESFTGWLLNSFQGYYRVGDRVRVGDVFGDVYRIDFLTTTVWEIGAPYQPGFVLAEQPTGRLVTFPNNEILTGTVINLTRDFPYVWDELAFGVANESDISLATEVLGKVAEQLLGNYMVTPARNYAALLKRAGLDYNIADKPQVFISLEESWTNIIIRYLVGARERRKWKSELSMRLTKETAKPEYRNKIIPVYPRQQVQFINQMGMPVEAACMKGGNGEV